MELRTEQNFLSPDFGNRPCALEPPFLRAHFERSLLPYPTSTRPARFGDPHAGDFNGATADNHAFGLRRGEFIVPRTLGDSLT